MRSAAERLEANDRIFKLSKTTPGSEAAAPDEDAILRELGVNDEERRNKMLTWDEVRFMKKQGMDFGGHTVTHPFLAKDEPRPGRLGSCRMQAATSRRNCSPRSITLPIRMAAREDFGDGIRK